MHGCEDVGQAEEEVEPLLVWTELSNMSKKGEIYKPVSTTVFPIFNEAVAAGEGALLTLTI